MFTRQTAAPLDVNTVQVVFNDDGRAREVLVADTSLAGQFIANRRDTKATHDRLQQECNTAEATFDAAAKAAEALYKATADQLRIEADAAIAAARDRATSEASTLASQRVQLEDTAFQKAEVQLVHEARASH